MKLGETVTYPSLEGLALCGSILYSLCVPSDFGGRPGFYVNMSCIFPHVVVAVGTLVGVETGDGVFRARIRCELGLLLCSVVNTTLLRVGLWPKLLEEKP